MSKEKKIKGRISTRYLFRFFSFLLFIFPTANYPAQTNTIIPHPRVLTFKEGHFTLDRSTSLYRNSGDSLHAITYLQSHLRQASGFTLSIRQVPEERQIRFLHTDTPIYTKEGYILIVSDKNIIVKAHDSAGFFYGTITLMQMMDAQIWSTNKNKNVWHIPSCYIKDAPHYPWRGMMLDVSRNFFSVAYVKKFIDRMAQYKLNRFHWHLTDDEGWRIEIRHYPLLTKIGARRGPGTKLPFSTSPAMRGSKNQVQSGYYTQPQIREIIAYAKAREIEVIPEIDLPGHAKAAVTAYPKLLLDPEDTSRYRSVQKIANNTINPALESTYIFLDNVIGEVAALFPFRYIHLGGDEVPKGAWSNSPAVKELMRHKGLKTRKGVENYFFTRMDRILKKHGKKLAGWQEVIGGRSKIRRSSLIMAWKNPKAGYRAIRQGYPTVMAPVQYLYFDQQYLRSKKEPGHTWSTPVSLKKVYSFTPPGSARGIQACLWSETLLNTKIADYLAWPRTLALSEVAWSPKEKKNWHDFRRRVKQQALPRLKAQQIHYRGY